MMHRRHFTGALLAGALGGLSPAAAAASVTVIRIGVISFYATGKIQLSGLDYVIEQQGWLRGELARRGIGLEWYPAPAATVGPSVNEAFASGKIQFATYGELPGLILNGNGQRIITQLLIPSRPSDSYLIVPKDSPARRIEDLKGKRLAINKGRPWELPLLRLLDSKHLSYADFQVYNINPDAGGAALAAGAMDAMATLDPYGLVDKGVAKIIWSTKDAPLSWKMLGGLWGSKDFADQHSDLAQLVVTAYVKAARWASDEKNRDFLIKLDTRGGASEVLVRQLYEDPHLNWKDRWSPLISPAVRDHYRTVAAYAFEKKIIRTRLEPEQILQDRFSNAAIKSLGLEGYWQPSKDITATQ